jgi:hypothetical protein
MASSSAEAEETSKKTLTIRIIRSFIHANWKPYVIHDVDLSSILTEELIELIYNSLSQRRVKLPPPFISYKGYDTLKVCIFLCKKNLQTNFLYIFQIETHRFGHKTNDPLMNLEDDDKLILKPGLTLDQQGVGDETEISFFNMADYISYKDMKQS